VSLELREVNKDNLRTVLRLKVAPEQEQFVASNAISIAQAYFEPGKPPYLWRFMIDARYQRRGLGAQALELVFAHARSLPGATEIFCSCVDAPGGPGPFYEKLGFAYTGEVDEGERVMRRAL
jgi:diamine N-acetyltransferase